MATYYSSRRTADFGYSGNRSRNEAWAPNRNAVRHKPSISLGPIWQTSFMVVLVGVLGILFLSQSSAVTTYDRSIASINSELMNLEAERDALAVENAKINAAAASEDQNQVASSMVNAASSAYVSE